MLQVELSNLMTISEILQPEWLPRRNADLFQNSHFNCEIKTMDTITKIVGKREVSTFSEIIWPFIKTAIFNQEAVILFSNNLKCPSFN
jgi:hypothetical protein